MIRIHTGHLGSGNWKIKQQDDTLFLSHRLPFSPRNEYRIGCNEVLDMQVVSSEKKNTRIVDITLSEDRSCQALVDDTDFDNLMKMVNSTETAPIEQDSTKRWVNALILFFAACVIFELIK